MEPMKVMLAAPDSVSAASHSSTARTPAIMSTWKLRSQPASPPVRSKPLALWISMSQPPSAFRASRQNWRVSSPFSRLAGAP